MAISAALITVQLVHLRPWWATKTKQRFGLSSLIRLSPFAVNTELNFSYRLHPVLAIVIILDADSTRCADQTHSQPGHIFFGGGEGKDNFWGNCLRYYAYRKMVTVKKIVC